MARLPLQQVVDQLVALYGVPPAPRLTRLLDLLVWENVAYLVDDERRALAFQRLREQVGSTPAQLLAAPREALVAIAGAGILPDHQAGKLRRIAEIVVGEFGGDLERVRRLPLPAARKALLRFPGVGEPGAEKILLFSRAAPVLALDSHGVRVLLRLGFGEESKRYSVTYRSVQQAAHGEIEEQCSWLIRTHQVLRRHGQELCRRSRPSCEVCPLASGCAYYAAQHAR
jgi:endonuclease-3